MRRGRLEGSIEVDVSGIVWHNGGEDGSSREAWVLCEVEEDEWGCLMICADLIGWI
jgi:hypothetical protein